MLDVRACPTRCCKSQDREHKGQSGGGCDENQYILIRKKHGLHDALEFPDGETVLVTELREGQHATVLQLPAPVRATEADPTERASVGTLA